MNNKTITPLGHRVLLRFAQHGDLSRGGIAIPEVAKEKPQEAEVIAIGQGEFSMKPGDRVITPKFGGVTVTIEGEELTIMEEHQILANIQGQLSATRDNVIVKLAPRPEFTEGGIFKPEETREVPMEGGVMAIGPDVDELSIGDTVGIPKHLGTAVLIGGTEMVVLKVHQVLYVQQ